MRLVKDMPFDEWFVYDDGRGQHPCVRLEENIFYLPDYINGSGAQVFSWALNNCPVVDWFEEDLYQYWGFIDGPVCPPHDYDNVNDQDKVCMDCGETSLPQTHVDNPILPPFKGFEGSWYKIPSSDAFRPTTECTCPTLFSGHWDGCTFTLKKDDK